MRIIGITFQPPQVLLGQLHTCSFEGRASSDTRPADRMPTGKANIKNSS